MPAFDEKRYESTTYRRCGKSGLKLPPISLGAWETFGGYRGEDVARECLFRAFDLGITHFDLANNYGRPPGNAEIVCGKIFKEMPRDELIISTKAGYLMWPGPYGEWGSRKYLIASLDQSLKRMGLEYVDIFYSHRPDPDTPLEETLGTLNDIVRQGKAIYAGVSSYNGKTFLKSVSIVRREHWAPITIHQPCYNMINRSVEKDLLKHTTRQGAGVIAFCPLAQGLLTDKYLDGVPADSRAALWWSETTREKRFSKPLLEKLRALNELAKQRGQSLAQMALAWLLRDDRVTSALIGASKVSQIEENVKALANTKFDASELKKIDRITIG
jgi:L-glyceraldehyde 3-phosphate reductase